MTQSYNSSCIHTNGNDIKVGGWGGNGGTPWTFTIPNDCKLSKIRIVSHGCVYSIQFTYLNPQGREIDSPVYGTDWGDGKIEIVRDRPFITSVYLYIYVFTHEIYLLTFLTFIISFALVIGIS